MIGITIKPIIAELKLYVVDPFAHQGVIVKFAEKPVGLIKGLAKIGQAVFNAGHFNLFTKV